MNIIDSYDLKITQDINIIKQYQNRIANIGAKFSFGSNSQRNQDDYNFNYLNDQIRQKFKNIALNVQEVLKVVDHKIITLTKYIKKKITQQKQQQKNIQSYKDIIHKLQLTIKQHQKKQTQLNIHCINLSKKCQSLELSLNKNHVEMTQSKKKILQLQQQKTKIKMQQLQAIKSSDLISSSHRNSKIYSSHEVLKQRQKSTSKQDITNINLSSSIYDEKTQVSVNSQSKNIKKENKIQLINNMPPRKNTMKINSLDKMTGKKCSDKQHRFQFLMNNLKSASQSNQKRKQHTNIKSGQNGLKASYTQKYLV